MTDWERLQQYNEELLGILLDMASTPDFEERRQLFHREVHRVFEPGFFPTLVGLLKTLAERGEKNQIISFSVFAAIVMELRAFFEPLDLTALSSSAACADLISTAAMAQVDPEQKRDAGHDFVLRVSKYRAVHRSQAAWQAFIGGLRSECERIAEAAHARRNLDTDQPSDSMLDQVERMRELPRRVELIEWLGRVAEMADPQAIREQLRRPPLEIRDPRDVVAVAHELDEIRKQQRTVDPDNVDQVLALQVLQAGTGVNLKMIEGVLTTTSGTAVFQTKKELLQLGPIIVFPVLHQTIGTLRQIGTGLRNSISEFKAQQAIIIAFDRATDLIVELCQRSLPEAREQTRKLVGTLLSFALDSDDPDLRLVAVLCCGLAVVPAETVMGDLLRLFLNDDELVIKLAAAAMGHGKPNVPDAVREPLQEYVIRHTWQLMPNLARMPEEEEEYRQAGFDDSDEAAGCAVALIPWLLRYLAQRESEDGPRDSVFAGGRDPTSERARAWIDRGNQHMNAEDYDQAIGAYTEAIMLKPRGALGYGQRGLAYLAKFDVRKNDQEVQRYLELAFNDFNVSIDCDPHDAVGFWGRGLVHLRRGEQAQATTDIRQVLRMPGFENLRLAAARLMSHLEMQG